MAVSVKAIVQTRGALVAAIVAVSLGLLLVVQQYLQTFATFIAVPQMLVDGSGSNTFAPTTAWLVITVLPLVVGVFLSLWLLAPIAPELRVGHVIARSILAVGIGCTLAFITLAVIAIVGSVSFAGTIFGRSFPSPVVSAGSIVAGLGAALSAALIKLVQVAPVGVLGGVLAWIWLTRHPAKHPVSGMLDEV